MIFCWEENILSLNDNKTWHLQFLDVDGMGNFELMLDVEGMDTYTLVYEDGSDFRNKEKEGYPYFLFDYADEVIKEIQRQIADGAKIIDIRDIIKTVKAKWNNE